MTQTDTNLIRANTLTVSIQGKEFVAHYYRTHKHLADLPQHSTTWTPTSDNGNIQREEYRQFAIAHAHELGLYYQPEDQRTADNLRKASYATDADLTEDAITMIYPDIADMLAQTKLPVSLAHVSVDAIVPRTTTPKGTALSTMGILDGKYERSQKWAWADLQMCATIATQDATKPVYATFQMALVSGQLKKPSTFDGSGWTKTAWTTYLTKELDALGLLPKEAPAAQPEIAQPQAPAPESQQAPTEQTQAQETHKPTKAERKAMREMESKAAQDAMAQ